MRVTAGTGHGRFSLRSRIEKVKMCSCQPQQLKSPRKVCGVVPSTRFTLSMIGGHQANSSKLQ